MKVVAGSFLVCAAVAGCGVDADHHGWTACADQPNAECQDEAAPVALHSTAGVSDVKAR